MSRFETYAKILLGENLAMPQAVSRVDSLLKAIIEGASSLPIVPISAVEKYLAHMIDSSVEIPAPETRTDRILNAISTGATLSGYTEQSEMERLLNSLLVYGANILNPADIIETGISTDSIYIKRTESGCIVRGWATELLSNEWVRSNLQASKTYYIKYKVRKIADVPSEYNVLYEAANGFLIYDGSGYENVHIGRVARVLGDGELSFNGTFTTPSALLDDGANYRILAYTERYIKSDGTSSAAFTTNSISDLIISETDVPYTPYKEG